MFKKYFKISSLLGISKRNFTKVSVLLFFVESKTFLGVPEISPVKPPVEFPQSITPWWFLPRKVLPENPCPWWNLHGFLKASPQKILLQNFNCYTIFSNYSSRNLYVNFVNECIGLQYIMYNHGINAVEFEYNTRS